MHSVTNALEPQSHPQETEISRLGGCRRAASSSSAHRQRTHCQQHSGLTAVRRSGRDGQCHLKRRMLLIRPIRLMPPGDQKSEIEGQVGTVATHGVEKHINGAARWNFPRQCRRQVLCQIQPRSVDVDINISDPNFLALRVWVTDRCGNTVTKLRLTAFTGCLTRIPMGNHGCLSRHCERRSCRRDGDGRHGPGDAFGHGTARDAVLNFLVFSHVSNLPWSAPPARPSHRAQGMLVPRR